MSTKILSTKQERLLDNRIDIIAKDFINVRINNLQHQPIKYPIRNVVITSKNAVESLLENFLLDELRFERIFVVGAKTKALIEKEIGMVQHVEQSAEKLANYLVNYLKEETVTFFCGNLRRSILPSILTKNDIVVHEIEAYRTELNTLEVTDSFNAILFFSPSAVESYLLKNESNDAVAFCIGETTAEEAKKSFGFVKIAEETTIESVVTSVNYHFEGQFV